jgi:hypothetical protein
LAISALREAAMRKSVAPADDRPQPAAFAVLAPTRFVDVDGLRGKMADEFVDRRGERLGGPALELRDRAERDRKAEAVVDRALDVAFGESVGAAEERDEGR